MEMCVTIAGERGHKIQRQISALQEPKWSLLLRKIIDISSKEDVCGPVPPPVLCCDPSGGFAPLSPLRNSFQVPPLQGKMAAGAALISSSELMRKHDPTLQQ